MKGGWIVYLPAMSFVESYPEGTAYDEPIHIVFFNTFSLSHFGLNGKPLNVFVFVVAVGNSSEESNFSDINLQQHQNRRGTAQNHAEVDSHQTV